MLSKSNGLSLELHSKSVAKLADNIAKLFLSEEIYKEHGEKIYISALIHDIGKCTKTFQNYIKSKINREDCEEEINEKKILHHEVSWAIAFCLFEKTGNESLLNAIYWHHSKPIYDGESKTNDYISNILNEISDEEIKEIYQQLIILISDKIIPFENFLGNINKNRESAEETPKYYIPVVNSSLNRFNVIYRSIIMTSDRISSELSIEDNIRVINDDEFCLSLLKNEKNILQYSFPSFYNKERLEIQCKIAKQCQLYNTVVVKATAGFGKTLIGLLWSLERKQKLLWVCPRNVVVESVYNSILSEINALGIDKQISVELFLTGSRKKCTNPEIKEFQSDIVITNIDNFLAPISKNRVGKWSVEIIKRDVVFDEYHEFLGDNALFGGFMEIMKLRHQMVNCNTILLSATPSIFHTFWDSPSKKTMVLPNDDEHYPAAHSKPYVVSFINENQVVSKNNSLIMTNSIHNAQLKKKELKTDMLVHSAFIDEDKDEIFQKLMECYKKGSNVKEKPSVSSSPIIQSSCDISFEILNKVPCSPESDLQTIGRNNRWGEYPKAIINFFTIESEIKSENSAIESLYNRELSDLWYDFLKKEIEEHGFVITLDELYRIYNKFNTVYKSQLQMFIKTKYEQGLISLSKIEPIKIPYFNKGKIKVSVTSENTLRNNGESVFVMYRRFDNRDEFVGPFSVTIPKYSNRHDFFKEGKEEDGKSFISKLQRVITTFIQTGRFNYPQRFKKKVNPELLFKYAHKESSPYVAFDKEYSKEFGLAKISIYNN